MISKILVGRKTSEVVENTGESSFGEAQAVDENDPEYDPEFDAGYTQEHVDRCSEIIDDFLASLEKAPDAQKNKYIMTAVKKTILRLNKLNEKCDGGLIETDQREDLAKLINLAAIHAGLESSDDDITYKWREW